MYWPAIISKYKKHKQLLFLLIIVGGSYICHAISFLVYGVIDRYNLMPNRKITKVDQDLDRLDSYGKLTRRGGGR